MSDVIEFAKVLRRKLDAPVVTDDKTWLRWALDAAIAEYESTRGREHAERIASPCGVKDVVAGSHPAPSPSLDDLRGTYDRSPPGSLSMARAAYALIAALESALAAKATEVAASQAESEGRRKALLAKADEVRAEWLRAEQAQAEVAQVRRHYAESLRNSNETIGGLMREMDEARIEVNRLRAMIVPGDAAAHEERVAALEQRAEAAERERDELQGKLVRLTPAYESQLQRRLETISKLTVAKDAAEAKLARLREPLTDEECAEVWQRQTVVDSKSYESRITRFVHRELLRLRGLGEEVTK